MKQQMLEQEIRELKAENNRLDLEVTNLKIINEWLDASIPAYMKEIDRLSSNPYGEDNHPLPPMEKYSE